MILFAAIFVQICPPLFKVLCSASDVYRLLIFSAVTPVENLKTAGFTHGVRDTPVSLASSRRVGYCVFQERISGTSIDRTELVLKNLFDFISTILLKT